MRRQVSLKVRFALVLTGVALGAMLLGFFATLAAARIELSRHTRATMAIIADIQARRVETVFRHANDTLSLIASRTRLRQELADHNRQPDAGSAAAMERILTDAIDAQDDLLSLSLRDARGQPVVEIRHGDAEATGHCSGESPSLDLVGQPPALWAHGPLSLDNRTVGQLCLRLSARRLLDLLGNDTGFRFGGQTLLGFTDREGGFHVLPTAEGPSPEWVVEGMRQAAQTTSAPPPAVGGTMDRDGELLAVRPLAAPAGTAVAVRLTSGRIGDLLGDLGILLTVLISLATLGAMGLAWLLGQTVVHPLERLTRATHRLQRGADPQTLQDDGGDEIARLTQSFNEMARTLNERTRRLEQEVHSRMHAEEQLRHLVFTDVLTALPNRRFFFEQMDNAPAGSIHTVAFFDLDRFKGINDRLGHEAGDLLLQTVADRLRSVLREEDTLCRLGGDEFAAMLMSAHGRADLEMLARRLHQHVAEPLALGGETVSPSISIGIACVDDSPRSLLARADAAMYRAKEQGPGHTDIDCDIHHATPPAERRVRTRD